MKAIAHCIVGGVRNVVNGNKFLRGFGSSFFTKQFASGRIAQKFQGNKVTGSKFNAVAGGTASVIGGGKFANGAYTNAFQYLFNKAGEILHTAKLSKIGYLMHNYLNPFGKKVVDYENVPGGTATMLASPYGDEVRYNQKHGTFKNGSADFTNIDLTDYGYKHFESGGSKGLDLFIFGNSNIRYDATTGDYVTRDYFVDALDINDARSGRQDIPFANTYDFKF